jgi:peptidoglycan/LPS O-acetylase OafA/YrhL
MVLRNLIADAPFLSLTLGVVPIVLVVACASYYLVERPALRLMRGI